MIADSPSQDRGVAQRPPTAGASSKSTPSGSEVMSSACSPASRWCGRSIITTFGALRSNSLSLMASGLTMLVSFFQVVRDRLGFVYVCFRERHSILYTRHRQPYPDRGSRKNDPYRREYVTLRWQPQAT